MSIRQVINNAALASPTSCFLAPARLSEALSHVRLACRPGGHLHLPCVCRHLPRSHPTLLQKTRTATTHPFNLLRSSVVDWPDSVQALFAPGRRDAGSLAGRKRGLVGGEVARFDLFQGLDLVFFGAKRAREGCSKQGMGLTTDSSRSARYAGRTTSLLSRRYRGSSLLSSDKTDQSRSRLLILAGCKATIMLMGWHVGARVYDISEHPRLRFEWDCGP